MLTSRTLTVHPNIVGFVNSVMVDRPMDDMC